MCIRNWNCENIIWNSADGLKVLIVQCFFGTIFTLGSHGSSFPLSRKQDSTAFMCSESTSDNEFLFCVWWQALTHPFSSW